MSPASFKKTTSIFTSHSFFAIVIIALLYIILATLLVNYQLVVSTIFGISSFAYKFTLLSQLVLGFFSAFDLTSNIFLILNSFLVGLNCILIFKTIRTLEGMGKIKLSIGGATLIGLVTAGCGACGFTIFSLLGISTSLSFLPFHGLEVHIMSFAVLLFSAIYMIKKLLAAKICSLY